MEDIIFESFLEVLKKRGIYQVSSFNTFEIQDFSNVTEEKVLQQIKIISEVHNRLLGYDGTLNKRLDNCTGKKVEQYKVYNKKFIRDFKKLKGTMPNNIFEDMLLKYGDEFIERAESCMKEVYSANYYGLISRSMRREEICLGNTSLSNLRKGENIEVIDISHCAYDMVECDALYLLSKIKRGGINLDWKVLIKEFCIIQNLDVNSERFIAAMLSYPYEFMKCYTRYRYGKKDWSYEEYKIKLEKAIEKDGCNIIC
jgi:hypothetical protein